MGSIMSREPEYTGPPPPTQQVFTYENGRFINAGVIRNDFDSFSAAPPTSLPPSSIPGISKTRVYKNPVNLKKNSVELLFDPLGKVCYLLMHIDSTMPYQIKIHMMATEEGPPGDGDYDMGEISLVSTIGYTNDNDGKVYEPGMEREVLLPLYTDIHELDMLDLTQGRGREGKEIFPLVIELTVVGSNTLQSQLTYCRFVPLKSASESAKKRRFVLGEEKRGEGRREEESYSVELSSSSIYVIEQLKQRIQYGKKSYQVFEIFGIKSDDETNKECVICLTEDKNTTLLPCRHLCLCSACAMVLRMKGSNCPICRHQVTSLLQINLEQEANEGNNLVT